MKHFRSVHTTLKVSGLMCPGMYRIRAHQERDRVDKRERDDEDQREPVPVADPIDTENGED